jgi:hypothetical protein
VPAIDVNTLFFMVGWDRYVFDKKRVGTRYAELVFSHLVGSAGMLCFSVCLGCEMLMHYFSC